jgi:hypothetical protein
MGLLAERVSTGRDGSTVTQPRNKSGIPLHSEVIDGATLYLCRQWARWVVVIESPRVNGAMPLRHSGRDSHDARFALLTLTRRACPDAAVISTDGALTSEDYEWRVEVRGIAPQPGDLGVALHRELSTETDGEESGRDP